MCGAGDHEEKDKILLLALTYYENGLNELGFPTHLARHPDNDGYFEAETVTDHSIAAREQFAKDAQKVEPGARVVIRYTRPPGKPLPVFEGVEYTPPETEPGEDNSDSDHP